MLYEVVYYRFTVLRTWKRYYKLLTYDQYIDLCLDPDVIVKIKKRTNKTRGEK